VSVEFFEGTGKVRHMDVVKRVLSGEASAELPNLLTEYFRLTPDTWGRDVYSGNYDWIGARKTDLGIDRGGTAQRNRRAFVSVLSRVSSINEPESSLLMLDVILNVSRDFLRNGCNC
jgi:hypothetical protein